MVNKFGLHVGVGEVCATSGPTERKTAIASVRIRTAAVRVCIKSFDFEADRISDAAASIKLPITPGSVCISGAGERVPRDRELSVSAV